MQADLTSAARPANYWTIVFFALLFAAGAVTCVAIGQSRYGDTERLLGFAGAAACVVCAWLLFRRVHPPRLYGVTLTVTPTEVGRGDEVSVTVDVRRGGGIEVGLVGSLITEEHYTDHQGRRQSRERRTVIHEKWHDLPDGGTTQALRFKVPLHGQGTVKTKDRRVSWAVVARKPARGRFDRHRVQVIRVRP
jgi:hypothetical protein